MKYVDSEGFADMFTMNICNFEDLFTKNVSVYED